MKRYLLLLILCLSNNIYTDEEQSAFSVKVISEVANITDDIAELIINNKNDKDPQVTKSKITNLIRHIATIVEIVIDKKSQKKHTRSISFIDNNQEAASLKEEQIEQLVQTALDKAALLQDEL